jgi:hypothetical protein
MRNPLRCRSRARFAAAEMPDLNAPSHGIADLGEQLAETELSKSIVIKDIITYSDE